MLCRFCAIPVMWVKTVRDARYMLFNAHAVLFKAGIERRTGLAVEYYDRQECHWDVCEGVDHAPRLRLGL
jgi:hypothetical protein